MTRITYKVDPSKPETTRNFLEALDPPPWLKRELLVRAAGFIYIDDGKYGGWDHPTPDGRPPKHAGDTFVVDVAAVYNRRLCRLVAHQGSVYEVSEEVFKDHIEPNCKPCIDPTSV